ncbi:hypothetical protein H6F86_05650 [Phormidium sp. FACHB-592]|uniref:Uncharacterized protein n=1 Tax=Stenomitos frigidus AS-A4 TaxID=2933935 RepID=A0ABV0KP55_9CYAN|nr:hypothetical protein [Phormidium sp. FACHB-592]MBD2073376.1 hypothetical protein [Phormidium sp. FACHB-592]
MLIRSGRLPWLVTLLVGLSALPVVVTASPSLAETAAVLRVSSQTAEGTTQTGMQRLVLGTQGLNLSFLRLNESVQKVWLDNPSRVVIDFDGCLSGGGLGGGDNSRIASCSGASIMRLRQLPQAIDFPKGIFADSNSTQLTVITTASGTRKVYLFQLVLAGGTPPYGMVEIVPSPLPAPAQLVSISQEYQQKVLSQLSQGLAIAETRNQIDKTSLAYQQLTATIALMQSGKPFAEAMQQTGVPSALVNRLRGYGNAP